jgi:hypothetical protein
VTRSALDPNNVNLRAEFELLASVEGEELGNGADGLLDRDAKLRPCLTSANGLGLPAALNPAEARLPRFSPAELIGLTFLKEQEDGTMIRAKVTKKINDLDTQNHQNIKMLLEIGDEHGHEELIGYIELCDIIDEQHKKERENPDAQFLFEEIIAHEGPLRPGMKGYNGSMWNIKVKWADGTTTMEPLELVAKDDPISCAAYGLKNELLDLPGWRRFRRLARREQKMKRMANHVQAFDARRGPTYQFGVQVPRSIKEAYDLDKQNGNMLWSDAIRTEMDQLKEYKTFTNMGRESPPQKDS